MSTKDYSAELLKMEGVQIEKLDETEEEIILQISMERKMHICKRCGGKTDRIHDYRVREVRDLELRGKPVRLLYRRRRYACPACGKRFSETNDFVGRYMRFTHRTAEKIMELLRRRSSMKDIAKDTGTSVSGVRLNPKFCVNSQRGENRSEFIVSGSGFIRLPLVCSITPAGMDVKGGGKAAVHRSAVQRRADP